MKSVIALTTVLCLAQYDALAGSISYTNAVTLATEHTLTAPIGVGASDQYTDIATSALPLFPANLGALQSVSISVGTTNATFDGDVSCSLIGLSIGYSQIQQIECAMTNWVTNLIGASVGPSNQVGSVQLGYSQFTTTTNPASLNMSMLLTDSAQLAAFTGSGGAFNMEWKLNSTYTLGGVSVGTTMHGSGNYPIQVSVTYIYLPVLSITPMAMPGPNSSLLLSYATNAENLVIQTSTNLLTWYSLTNTVSVSNGNCNVMLPFNQNLQFFRLGTP
jgi:hypothetical protein